MKRIVIINIVLVLFFLGINEVNAQDNFTNVESIKSLLQKKREYNKYNGSGYRIQLYNGQERRARNIKASFESKFLGVFTKLSYKAPEWKVQVGSYRTRLDADRALNRIREKFSGAIIVKK